MSDKLTDKQKLFCEAYLSNGFNLSKAVIEAGYDTNNPRNIGAENYAKPYIKEYIQSRIKERLQGHEELTEKLLAKWSEITFYENQGLPESPGGNRPGRKSVHRSDRLYDRTQEGRADG